MNAWIVWLQFLLCLTIIGVAGFRLSRYGDIIASKTGMGGNWIGLILLATVTSLPELVTGISSVTLAHSPNIAIGDALGSCVFNLVIIVMLDFLLREESVYRRAHQGHILAAGFSVIMLGVVAFNMTLGENATPLSIGHVGLYTPLILIIYLFAIRTVFLYESRQRPANLKESKDRYQDIKLREAVIKYCLTSLVVVAAGIWLPFLGVALADAMGWHKTFVGTMFVAFATSVPEMVVTVAALRIGALDMAIGGLLGSNLFDIAIIAIDDLLFLEGPILYHVSPLHALSAMSAMVMTGTAIVGLFYRPSGRVLKTVGWTSLFLVSIYMINSYVLYLYAE